MAQSIYEEPAVIKRTERRGVLHEITSNGTIAAAVMVGAALLALVVANGPAFEAVEEFLREPLEIGIGTHLIAMSVESFVNDFLMAIFFLLVGIELKYEMTVGQLRRPRQAALPMLAAVGGVCLPALIYLLLDWGGADPWLGRAHRHRHRLRAGRGVPPWRQDLVRDQGLLPDPRHCRRHPGHRGHCPVLRPVPGRGVVRGLGHRDRGPVGLKPRSRLLAEALRPGWPGTVVLYVQLRHPRHAGRRHPGLCPAQQVRRAPLRPLRLAAEPRPGPRPRSTTRASTSWARTASPTPPCAWSASCTTSRRPCSAWSTTSPPR